MPIQTPSPRATVRSRTSGEIPGIRRHYVQSVRWVVARLDLFATSDLTNPESMKESTELALFYCFASLYQPSLATRELRAIRHFLSQWLSNRLLAEWLLKCPGHYSPSAIAYLAMRATGVRIAAFEDVLSRLQSAGFPHCLELTPYRSMELEYILWKSGLASHKPAMGSHFRASSFALVRNPVYLTQSEVYSITHTLLYLTDFAGPCRLPVRVRQRGIDMVRALLVHYRRIRDWDITGELLLNLIGLDSDNDPLFTATLRALCAAQRNDGAVPGPNYCATDAHADDREYIFKHCYHTTLVSMILWAACLKDS
jgi:hypothetical protein